MRAFRLSLGLASFMCGLAWSSSGHVMAQEQTVVAVASEVQITYQSGLTIDRTFVNAATELSDQQIAQASEQSVVVFAPRREQLLQNSLRALAEVDSRFTLRQRTSPTTAWFKKGGTGYVALGKSNKPMTRIEGLAKGAKRLDRRDRLDAVGMQVGPREVARPEVIRQAVERHYATMDIRAENATLQGSRTANIVSPLNLDHTSNAHIFTT